MSGLFFYNLRNVLLFLGIYIVKRLQKIYKEVKLVSLSLVNSLIGLNSFTSFRHHLQIHLRKILLRIHHHLLKRADSQKHFLFQGQKMIQRSC